MGAFHEELRNCFLKHKLLFFTSAGNNGPALSTVAHPSGSGINRFHNVSIRLTDSMLDRWLGEFLIHNKANILCLLVPILHHQHMSRSILYPQNNLKSITRGHQEALHSMAIQDIFKNLPRSFQNLGIFGIYFETNNRCRYKCSRCRNNSGTKCESL